MGNRIGCQFIGPGCAWNGGQWHSPASFQTLFLEMKWSVWPFLRQVFLPVSAGAVIIVPLRRKQ